MNLADKIEALTGPDRAAFTEAWRHIHYAPWMWGGSAERQIRFKQLLDVEAWEQAALMLVPEGWRTSRATEDRRSRTWNWELRRGNRQKVSASASSLALALLAAALRATQHTSASGCVG